VVIQYYSKFIIHGYKSVLIHTGFLIVNHFAPQQISLRIGFFGEVGVDDGQEQPVVLRSFVSSVPLEDYSYWVKLPEF